jgi:hypothetical protein
MGEIKAMKNRLMSRVGLCTYIKPALMLTVVLMGAGCSIVDGSSVGHMNIEGSYDELEALPSDNEDGMADENEQDELNQLDSQYPQQPDVLVNDEGVDPSPNPGDEVDALCLIECDGRECGDNGCGGLCGSCDDGLSCSDAGQCETPALDCTPQCFRNTCGDDGCGGQCGDCVDGSACAVYQNHSNPSAFKLCEAESYDLNDESPSCPPEVSEMGNELGDVVPEVALLECGSDFPINHRGMCGNILSITYQINVDCGPCIGYVNAVLGPLQEEFGPHGVQFYVVYDEPDECDTGRYFRDGAEEIKYVFAPLRFAYSHLFGTGGRASTLILSAGNRIEYYGKGDGIDPNGPSSEMLRGYIEAALNP